MGHKAFMCLLLLSSFIVFPIYNVHNPSGVKLFTRLRLGLSHLRAQKFNHNFSNCPDELCICGVIWNLRAISSSNAHCIYSKDKRFWRKSVILRFYFLIKIKIAFVILYSLVAIYLMTLKTSAYSV